MSTLPSSLATRSEARSAGSLFSVLQSVRANTYGQMIWRRSSLFGFFHKKASYVVEKRSDTCLRLFGFIGYVAYSVESGSLRRHKTIALVEEVNAESIERRIAARFHITPRQMICLVYDGELSVPIDDADISLVLSFVVEVLLKTAPMTERIAKYAVAGDNLRSL